MKAAFKEHIILSSEILKQHIFTACEISVVEVHAEELWSLEHII